jgi:hypothetical protein
MHPGGRHGKEYLVRAAASFGSAEWMSAELTGRRPRSENHQFPPISRVAPRQSNLSMCRGDAPWRERQQFLSEFFRLVQHHIMAARHGESLPTLRLRLLVERWEW